MGIDTQQLGYIQRNETDEMYRTKDISGTPN